MLVHFVGLLVRVWGAFTASLGNTTLGFFLPILVVPITGFSLFIGLTAIREGRQSVKDHLRRTLGLAAIVAVAGEFLVYGLLAEWMGVKTIYRDHIYLTGVAARLHQNLINKDSLDRQSFAPVENSLQAKLTQLQGQCLKQQGVAETLETQTRTQQSTINNCQTQALRLLAPVTQKTTLLTLEGAAKSSEGWNVSWLLLTNKEVTPANFIVSCSHEIKELSIDVVGYGGMMSGASKITPYVFMTGVSSPAWTPESPLRIHETFVGDENQSCSFTLK